MTALQRFHEALGNAVALRAERRREARLPARWAGEDLCALRDIRKALVGKPVSDRRCATCASAMSDGFGRDVPTVGPAYPASITPASCRGSSSCAACRGQSPEWPCFSSSVRLRRATSNPSRRSGCPISPRPWTPRFLSRTGRFSGRGSAFRHACPDFRAGSARLAKGSWQLGGTIGSTLQIASFPWHPPMGVDEPDRHFDRWSGVAIAKHADPFRRIAFAPGSARVSR